MGVYVYLHVWWDRVEAGAWREVYQDTLHLLSTHPSQILGLDERVRMGRDVLMYTRNIERKRGAGTEWCVVGDRASMRFAESFCMPRDPFARASAMGLEPKSRPADEDIVHEEPSERSGARVFSDKTQGEPYHVPIVAAAMVVEAKFPGAAIVFGDIDEADVREAKACAERALEREVPLPVLFDAPALLRRLSTKWKGPALLAAFARRFDGEPCRGLAHAFSVVDQATVEAYLRQRLAAADATTADGEAPAIEDVLGGYLRSGGALSRLCALAADPSLERRIPAERLVSMLAWTGMLSHPDVAARLDRCRAIPLPRRSDVSMLAPYLGAMLSSRMDLSGPRVELGALEAALAGAYGGRAAELLAKAQEETRRLEAHVSTVCDLSEKGARSLAQLDVFQDIGELVAVRSPEELCEGSRLRLAGFAHAVREARGTGRSPWPKALASGEDPAAARSFFVSLADRRPVLTEQAWEWILREKRPALLRLLCDLFCVEAGNEESSTLKRAVLESRVLCQEVARMMADDVLMAEEDERAKAARARMRSGK